MKIGASTFYGIVNKPATESVNELEKAGFDTIEIMYEYNNFLTENDIKILKKKDIDFSMHGPFTGLMFSHPEKNLSDLIVRLIKQSLESAVKIGCKEYVMHGGTIPLAYTVVENGKTREYFIDLYIKRFGETFREYSRQGIKIVFENMVYDSQIGSAVSDIIRIQKAIPEIGFCFDIAHSVLTNETRELIEKIKIDHVHATDNNLKNDDHFAIGDGKIDFRNIISDLKNKGFNGKIILENISYEDSIKSLRNLKNLL